MNSVRSKSAMLMTKGIMDLRYDPPRLICTLLTFQHPESKKEVTLYPTPNMASPSYFRRVLDADTLTANFDRVLCEDGRLPFQAGTAVAAKQAKLRRLFPFCSLRPVTADGEKFDGIVQRDAMESRMAYQMIQDGADPPVDPRARRGVERILDAYPENTRVVVPWGVYHMPYFRYRLQKEGFVQTNAEEVEVVGLRDMLGIAFISGTIAFMMLGLFVMLIFW